MQQFLSNFKYFQKKFKIKNGKYFDSNLNIKNIVKEFKIESKKKHNILSIKLKNFFENNLFHEKFNKFLKKFIKKNELIYKFKKKKKIIKITDFNDFNKCTNLSNLFLNNKYKTVKYEEKIIYFSLDKLFFNYEKWKYFQYALQNNIFKNHLLNYSFFSIKNVKNLNYYRFFSFKYNNLNFYDKNFRVNFFFKNLIQKFFSAIIVKQINYKTPSGFKTSLLKFKLNKKKNYFSNIFNILFNLSISKRKKEKYSKIHGYNRKVKVFEKNGKNFFLKKSKEILEKNLYNSFIISIFMKSHKNNLLNNLFNDEKKKKDFLFKKHKYQILNSIKNKLSSSNIQIDFKTKKKKKAYKPFPWLLKK